MSQAISFEFNTGRLYKADGQLIKCRYFWADKVKAHVITFNDTARGIWGWFPYYGQTSDRRLLQERVMAAYDNQCFSGDRNPPGIADDWS